jgi:glycerol uptake facilitator-like aquaporin
MATKKTASAAKKRPVVKKPSAPVATTTKVTTVKAASATRRASAFSFSRSPVLAASIAEFVGTFMLAAVVLSTQGSAIVVFFALMAIVFAVGAVSGAYVNPLLTVGAWATKRISHVRAASYLVAQVLGAMMALVVVNGFVSAAPVASTQSALMGQQGATLFKVSALVEGKEWYILAAELLGATVFAFAVAAAAREKSRVAKAFGVSGGLLVALVISTYCVSTVGMGGTILNPAVAAAVQALSWKVWPIMIYVITPLVGGILGFYLQDMLQDEVNA